MMMASSSPGSSSLTGWNRRDSAASVSKYFLYSAQVVAAIVLSSPRASAGFSRLAASLPPCAPPAPIRVWASSMNRMTGISDALTSSITDLSRFSNSPRTPAPACKRPRSSARISTPWRTSGTSPCTMRRARPSTTAVLPTPASPTTIGLFLRRRPRMSTICRISRSRPNTGSIFPARAWAVKSTVKRAKAESPERLWAAAPGPPRAPADAPAAPAPMVCSDDPETIASNSLRRASRLRVENRSR